MTLSRKKIHPWSWNGAKYKITAVVAETFFFLYIFSDLYFSLQVTINALDTFFHSGKKRTGPRVSVLLPWTLHFWGLPVCTARLTPLVIYVGYVRKKGSRKSRSCSVNTKQSISLSRSQRKSNINSIYETSQNPSCVFLRLIDVSVTGNQSRLRSQRIVCNTSCWWCSSRSLCFLFMTSPVFRASCNFPLFVLRFLEHLWPISKKTSASEAVHSYTEYCVNSAAIK